MQIKLKLTNGQNKSTVYSCFCHTENALIAIYILHLNINTVYYLNTAYLKCKILENDSFVQ